MSCAKLCFWLKIVSLLLLCGLSIFLFVGSLGISYQYELAREHTRFRKEMPTQDSWLNSPYGNLKSYLFNVTNADAFLNGTDARLKLEQVGPIVYKLQGHLDVLHRNETSITFRKNRYTHVEFSPELSVSPDILNQTIVLPNTVLLSAAIQFNDWNYFVRHAFNSLTLNEKIFLTNSIYYFMWEFTTPGLKMLAQAVPSMAYNCGTLYNALTDKEEVYTVKIGTEQGMENFFRIDTMNNQYILKQQASRARDLRDRPEELESCPINVHNSFDNSLFPPFLKREDKFSIVATDSCRTLPMRYQRDQVYKGYKAYRYSMLEEDTPTCLNHTFGTSLPKGMFDASKCVINDAPTAFSAPHYFGSGYNWSEHFEGLNPNAEEHEPHILIEPISGIPVLEQFRFQSNIPLPDLTHFNPRLGKLSNMMLPTFWYEFDLNELPPLVSCLIRFNASVTPVLQPILMTLFLLTAIWSLLKVLLLLLGLTYSAVYRKICGGGASNKLLETTFPFPNESQDVTQFAVAVK